MASNRSPAPARSAPTARPVDVLHLRAIRSPHAHARFTVGDLGPLYAAHPGLERVLLAADVPGQNRYGIYATGKDQPALADGYVRYRGEPVAALVGDARTVAAIADDELPIAWTPLDPLLDTADAVASGAPQLHDPSSGNVLTAGRVARGEVDAALAGSAITATGTFRTSHVEHAYIEPEAGYAERHGDRITVVASTQTPYMDRDEVALVLGIDPAQVRIVPTACGGGFGGKLDMAVQPLVAVAAWVLDRPVRCVFTRPESMRSTTKRHPAVMTAALGADADGMLTAIDFQGDFDTGAYASWGPTVANRVPVHASGPYVVPAVRATTRAIYTNGPIGGAFRGFGVPQAAVVHEALLDDIADGLGIDRLEIRLANALRAGFDHGHGAGARSERGPGAVPRGASTSMAGGARRRRCPQPRARRPSAARSGAAWGSGPCGTASATPRCPIRRPSGSASDATAATCCSAARRTSVRARRRS